MRLALCQINPTIGDLDANAALIERFTRQARDAGADLVVFPELALSGYPPKDLLLQQGFIADGVKVAQQLGEAASGQLTLVFGCPLPVEQRSAATRDGPGTQLRGVANSLLVYRNGRHIDYYDKRLLPTYDVFDEDRYFVPGERPVVIDVPSSDGAGGVGTLRVGLSICEDLWRGEDVGFSSRYWNKPDPVNELILPSLSMGGDGRSGGAQVIINPSASPFVVGKGRKHRDILRMHAVRHKIHVAAVNQVGGNDELIFDGHAAVYGPTGSLVAAAPGFMEHCLICDIPAAGPSGPPVASGDPLLIAGDEELVFRALVLGVRDYCRKTGFKSVVLGLSGGIDSAVCAVLAAAALGPANVLGVSLPSRYSSPGSKDDARLLAEALGTPFKTVPIEEPFIAFETALKPAFEGRAADVTEENLQSRCRGTILMALSNKFGHLLLTTGNKSEMAVGYCTLYGDMNGGLAVLSDLSKQWVYRLARWMNSDWSNLGIVGLKGPPIPDASITKPPSAELRPNQTDQDSLPPYEQLDEIIDRYVERRQTPREIVDQSGISAPVVARIIRLLDWSEYKRKQAATGLKVTGVAFGSGRRVPIAQRYRPERSISS